VFTEGLCLSGTAGPLTRAAQIDSRRSHGSSVRRIQSWFSRIPAERKI